MHPVELTSHMSSDSRYTLAVTCSFPSSQYSVTLLHAACSIELTCFSGILQSVLLKIAEHSMNPIWCTWAKLVSGTSRLHFSTSSDPSAPFTTLQKNPAHSTHTTRRSRPQLQYHLCEGALHLCGLVLIFVEWWSCYHQLVGLCGSFEGGFLHLL